jgi:hypothetical protein
MIPKTGQVIDCDGTPHVESKNIAWGLHVTDEKGPIGVVAMMTPADGSPLVVHPMTLDEAVHQRKALDETIALLRAARRAAKGGA